MPEPATFISWERADMDAVRAVLSAHGPFERSGVYLQRNELVLETSWLGGEDFYGTAWRFGADDIPLFFKLARQGRLLITQDERILNCAFEPDEEWITVRSAEQLAEHLYPRV